MNRDRPYLPAAVNCWICFTAKEIFASVNILPISSVAFNPADAKRGYRHAICEFVDWYCSEPRLEFKGSWSYIIELEQAASSGFDQPSMNALASSLTNRSNFFWGRFRCNRPNHPAWHVDA
jgi:hypothetical protein